MGGQRFDQAAHFHHTLSGSAVPDFHPCQINRVSTQTLLISCYIGIYLFFVIKPNIFNEVLSLMPSGDPKIVYLRHIQMV